MPKSKLQTLAVIPLDRVVPHEHVNPERVARLSVRLQKDKTLANPVIVVKWLEHYVVLDGATRVTAFKRLGYPHIVAQVVSPHDEGINLHVWHHVICGPDFNTLLSHFGGVSSYVFRLTTAKDALEMLDDGEALCALISPEGKHYLTHPAPGVDNATALNALVARYTEIGNIRRTINHDLSLVLSEIPDFGGMVVFPRYTLLEVLQVAVSGQLIPAGVTRFIVPGRVLHLHADMEKLRNGEALTDKNVWLKQILHEKMASRRVRFYQEPVILLDE